MTNTFKLSELSESTLVGRNIGKNTRKKIQLLVEKHGLIIIDMENNSSISPSFLDEAIITLVLEYKKENFNKYIQLINIHVGIKSLMNTILHNKSEKK